MKSPISRNFARLAFGCAACIATLTLSTNGLAQVRIEAEAYSGAPFGVGRVTIISGSGIRINGNLPIGNGRLINLGKRVAEQLGKSQQEALNLESAEVTLAEKSGRVYYPVFEKRERPILREFVSMPTQTTVLFLFQGDAPLDLTAYTPMPTAGRVTAVRDAARHQSLLAAWWRDYSAAADGRNALQEYPPLVEEYLTDTLSRRLQLALPQRRATSESSIFQSELNLLLGTETARLEAAREILTATAPLAAATERLPEELPRPKPELLNPPDKTQIEPIAMRVPVECLYVRFGNFPNFLWFQHRLDEFGGELRDVVSERGLDYRLMDRMQRQLGLKTTALAEVMGDRLIADVALIGLDTFMGEGSAMGTLFHARNNPLLAANLTQQRLSGAKEAKNATQGNVEIGGRQVSLIATPDNTIRSFQVADGDFHLVTNSRTLVEWFLATGAGNHESVGASEAFLLSRASFPLERNDAVFAYLSPDFFQHLMSAHYQIELKRRLRSAVEIELFRFARLAAQSEHKPGGTIDELVAGGYLPQSFGKRVDGSQLELIGDDLVDSLRGRHGTFAPIPDMAIDRVTPDEKSEYMRLADAYTNQWGAMDPLVAAIGRETLPQGGLERVVVDIQAAPLSKRHSEMLAQWLGPASDVRLAPVPGDVVSFEAVMRGGTFFSGGDHHLFGALRDADPRIALDPRVGLVGRILLSNLEGLNGYVGAWPDPGFLRLLGVLEGQRDANGYSRLLLGPWQRQYADFTLLSFHQEILAQISPQLKFVKALRPAQAWLHADDLTRSQLAPLLNAYGYRQSRQIMQGNTRFMNMLSEQLHVPQAAARTTAEQLLGAHLESPLGGEYQLRDLPGGSKSWVSTALVERPDPQQVPADYQFPALNWLRGVDAELRFEEGLVVAHAELVMPAEIRPAASGFSLPSLFGGAKANEKQPSPSVQPPAKAPAAKGAGPQKF